MNEVVVYLVTRQPKTLLVERLNPNDPWFRQIIFPGGKIEAKDRHHLNLDYRVAALKREMKEELNIEPTHFQFLYSRSYPEEQGDLLHLFKVTQYSGRINPREKDKERFFWCNIQLARTQTTFQSVRDALQAL